MKKWLLVPLVIPAIAMGQELVSANLIGEELNEVVQPEVSVSGSVIVGVMTSDAASAIVHNVIAAQGMPGGEDRKLCLRAASNDGIYTSKNVYGVPGGVTGAVHLPYATSEEAIVKTYTEKAGQIAVSASAGDCDSGNSSYHVVTSSEASGDDSVYVYINSFGATDVFYEISSGESGTCNYISEGRRTTYDFFCKIKADAVGAQADIAIIRERFGREQPAVELKVIGANR